MYLRKTGKPLGLSKNVRTCIWSAGRDRTFEGDPIHGGRRSKVQQFFDICKFMYTKKTEKQPHAYFRGAVLNYFTVK